MFTHSKYYSFCLAFLLLLATGLVAFQVPDSPLIQTIKARLATYTEHYQPDKLYLMTDRPYYTSGETVWLKAFQVDASEHTPHSRSRVIYVDLLNDAQKLIHTLKLRVENNGASGDLVLPAGLPSGKYTLRAYTKWMLNAGTHSVFSKSIQVYQPDQPTTLVSGEALPVADLQFFPEGGNLVSGLTSTVAFKAVNKLGKGVDVQGIITSQRGDTAASFQSFHAGMGAFQLQPQTGQTYTATLVTSVGDTLWYPLPVPLSDGWVMTTDNTSSDVIKVQLQSKGNGLSQASIIAQARGKVLFSATSSSADALISIPKHTLPEGIVQITAFDELGNARCERLAFVKHGEYVRIQVSPGKKIYNPREKVSLDITAQDKSGNPVAATMAMVITDASQVTRPEYTQTIRSYLLLSSDLKGYVEQPEYYFSADTKADKALDYLLLTQGWRRFSWKEVLQSTLPGIRYDMENGLSLAGQLINASTKSPVPNQLVTLSVPGGNPAFYQEYTDQDGKFEFMDFNYFQDKDVFLRPISQTGLQSILDTSLAISLPPVPLQDFAQEKVTNFIHKTSQLSKIQAAYKTEEDSQEPQATEDDKQPVRMTVADVPADHIIELDKYNQFPSMPETLKEIVPGLIIKDKKGVYSLRVLNIKRKMYFTEEPVYFVDGLLFTTNDILLTLDPASVQAVEVFGRPEKLARFGNFGQNGVIAAYTRSGDFYPADLPGLMKIPFRGYSQTREFYSPVYDNPNAERQKPDLRPLIYWNSSITTDANGKAQVTFYNADNIGTYEVHVEGISAEGLPGSMTTSYDVHLPVQSKR
ncbi:MG2 domain-containing protein [Rhodocytophaga aerolata]|uniref:MG2 domain-containing protein n=1 Tax=Rhodocytophaga aerolata TaxID=455078 RepID=A0ABT8R0Q3_9BACT|nr:MG2 domain-containing protein [Rhodocytophaga aerolata]MDO1445672.1 MG2 domain-containing protein [Rhodocytophaga aerolata]